jgi:hypothetical protein
VTRQPLFENILCITLPRASSTAWDVKFSEGMRLIKCFCLRFSWKYAINNESALINGNGETYILEDAVDSRVCMFKIGSE